MAGEPFGLVGMGGYAGQVLGSILERTGEQRLKLAGVHDPAAESFPELLTKLRERGVRIYKTYEELLASPIKALWLPVPIDLHRSFTEKALAAGKAVLCEKPAAGSIQDVEAMIKARDAANHGGGLAVAIGYQHLYVASTHRIKRRILAGELGKVSEVTIGAALPRASAYYARPWAGKLQRNGVWILDSPANNAMAHYVHLALFLLGPELMTSARPAAVEAELYRVNGIENYDTCCIRVTVEGEARVLICMTHATKEFRAATLKMHGERGTFTYAGDSMNGIWEWGGERAVVREALPQSGHLDVLAGFEALLADGKSPHASLEMSRMHALASCGASQCAPVATVRAPFMQVEKHEAGTLSYIPGIAGVFDEAISRRKMLHETGLAPWTVAPGKMDLRGYAEFTGPAKG